jgi:hypothetical protein
MKLIPSLPVLVILLVLAPLALAFMPIEIVSKERAKELGIEVSVRAAGPDAAGIEMTFEPRGDLRNFLRVDLSIQNGDKLVLHSTMKEQKNQSGKITVYFAVARDQIDKCTLRIVSGQPGDLSGSDVPLKDFINAQNIK